MNYTQCVMVGGSALSHLEGKNQHLGKPALEQNGELELLVHHQGMRTCCAHHGILVSIKYFFLDIQICATNILLTSVVGVSV